MADSPDFAKGATAGPGYDTTPGGLGLSPAYLGGATANASLSASSTSGTSFPAAPADGQEYVYVADATNGVFWKFRWYAAGNYWAFVGGSPLSAEVATSESTSSATYTALTTPGPLIVLPFAGDYIVSHECAWNGNEVAGDSIFMSYDIGGTAAVDADGAVGGAQAGGVSNLNSIQRNKTKTGLAAVTLTAKYRTNSSTTTFRNRRLSVLPVKK